MTSVQMTASAETAAKSSRPSSDTPETSGAKDLFESLVKNQGKSAGAAKSNDSEDGEADAGAATETKDERSSKASSGAKGRIGFERMLAGTGEGAHSSRAENAGEGGETAVSADGEASAMAGLVAAAALPVCAPVKPPSRREGRTCRVRRARLLRLSRPTR